MFTMAKIRDGSTYLSQHLTANDYYSENESITGHWTGRGAERLGLAGEINSHDAAFENLRQNRLPNGAAKLTPRDGLDRVRFYDFQCSAQKSVSIMAVTMGDERLLSTHDRAARVAFAELEKFAATQANTALTRSNRVTGNVVAAAFRHTASRALDPQIHTHFVTANATWDEASQSWRALTEYEMVHAIRYAGKVYQNELAKACLDLGYKLEPARDERGAITGFEITGVDAAIRERFSKRRAQVEHGIEAFVREHGRSPSTAEIHAITVDSRDPKLKEITTPAVLANQRRQLSAEEWARLSGVVDGARARTNDTGHVPPREKECLHRAVAHLFERRSVAKGHELLAEALNQSLGNVDLRRLQDTTEKPGLIRLTDQPLLQAEYSTQRGLACEQWAVAFVDRTKNRFPELGRAPLAPELSDAQRRAAAEILSSRDQVVCLRGLAGVGKTTLLKSLQPALRAKGRVVFHCAPTSSAADTLRKEGLGAATTVSDFLAKVALRDRDRLKGSVIVVDEAGLASNTQGAEILRLAERNDGRVVFVGDARQHTSVEAGDFVRILERHSQIHRVDLSENRRQKDEAYRSAVQQLARGATRDGLEQIDDRGWMHEHGPDYLRAAAREYTEHAIRGESVIAVTPTWAENHAFSYEARAQLKQHGVLGEGENVTVQEPLQWTKAQKARADNYAPDLTVTFQSRVGSFARGTFATVQRVANGQVWVEADNKVRRLPLRSGAFEVSRSVPLEICPGDRLLVRSNHREAGILNGDIVTVRSIRDGVITTDNGRSIDTRRVRDLSYGYAVTSHKSQSKTVDHVVVAAQHLDSKSAYVACSRGRLSCSVHTPDKAHLLDRLPTGARPAALDIIADRERPPPDAQRRKPPKRWHERMQAALTSQWWRTQLSGLWVGSVTGLREEQQQRQQGEHHEGHQRNPCSV